MLQIVTMQVAVHMSMKPDANSVKVCVLDSPERGPYASSSPVKR